MNCLSFLTAIIELRTTTQQRTIKMAELILPKDLPAPNQIVSKLLQIKALKEQLDALETEIRSEYKQTNPSKKLLTSAGEISVTESQRLTFDNALVLALCASKEIDPLLLGSFEFKADEKKVQSAIATGIITNDELTSIGAVKITTFDRFTIKPTQEVNDVLAVKSKAILLQLTDGNI